MRRSKGTPPRRAPKRAYQPEEVVALPSESLSPSLSSPPLRLQAFKRRQPSNEEEEEEEEQGVDIPTLASAIDSFDQLPNELGLEILYRTRDLGNYATLRALCDSSTRWRSLCHADRRTIYSGKPTLPEFRQETAIGNVPLLFDGVSSASCVLKGLLQGLFHASVVTANRLTALWNNPLSRRLRNRLLPETREVAYRDRVIIPNVHIDSSSLSPSILLVWATSESYIAFATKSHNYALTHWQDDVPDHLAALFNQIPVLARQHVSFDRQLVFAWDSLTEFVDDESDRLLRDPTYTIVGEADLNKSNQLRREWYTLQQLRRLSHTRWGRMGIYSVPQQYTSAIIPLGTTAMQARQEPLPTALRILAVASTTVDASDMLGIDLAVRFNTSPSLPSNFIVRHATREEWNRDPASVLGIHENSFGHAVRWYDQFVYDATPQRVVLRPPAWTGYQVPQRLEAFLNIELYVVVSRFVGICLCGHLYERSEDYESLGESDDQGPCRWNIDRAQPWYPRSV